MQCADAKNDLEGIPSGFLVFFVFFQLKECL